MADEKAGSGADKGAASQTQDAQKVQDFEARATKAEQERASLQAQLDALQPYVNFGTQQQGAQQPQTTPEDPEARLDQAIKNVDQKLTQTSAENMTEIFFARNSDLEDHQDLVSTIFQNSTDPRKPVKARLAEAATKARDYIKKLEERGAKKVKDEMDAKKVEDTKKAAAATGGIMEGGNTPPPASEAEGGWTQDDYAARRRQQQNETFAAGSGVK
jgi:hypothetical protein